ncbi:MAG: tetratricopeptide repeat protein [bacterium]
MVLVLLLVPAGLEARPSLQEDPVTVLCSEADRALAGGDPASAYRLYQRAHRKDSKSVRPLLGMGRAMMKNPAEGTWAQAHFREAVRLAPEDPQVRYEKALAHLRMSRSGIGKDAALRAREELEAVVRLNPSHPEAWYQLGRLHREVFEDFAEAIPAYRRQVAANPAHMEARRELVESYALTGEWQSLIELAETTLERDEGIPVVYPYLAAAYWAGSRWEEAMETFRRYFEVVGEEERDLYRDLSVVLTPGEAAEFEDLDEEGRRNFRGHYWEIRDPDPRTEVNERLLEHYIRVAYSRLEFAGNTWPWDARGTFFIRYGEPDLRIGYGRPYPEDLIDHDPEFNSRRRALEQEMGMLNVPGTKQAGSGAWAFREPERWVYLDRGIDISFEDPTQSGSFRLVGNRSRILMERMEERMPVLSEEEERIGILDPLDSALTFRGPEGTTRLEYAYALLPDEFGPLRSATGAYAVLDVFMQLYTPEWIPVAGAADTSRRVEIVPQVRIRGLPLFVDGTRMSVEPGSYVLTTMLLDPETGGRAISQEEVEIPDYSGSELTISDLLTAAWIQQVPGGTRGRFVRGDLEVLPLPGATVEKDRPLFIYYEIYNLAKDDVGATDRTVRYQVSEVPENRALTARLFRGIRDLVGLGPQRAVLSSDFQTTGIRSDVESYFELDMNLAPAGTYQLQVTVTDNLTGESATSVTIFRTVPAY